MTTTWEAVVVSSDLANRQTVAQTLARQGVDALCTSTVRQLRGMLNTRNIGLVFCDRQLSDGNYRDIMRAVGCSVRKMPEVVVMAAGMTPVEYEQAKRSGVFNIITTPCESTDIEWTVTLARRVERFAAKLMGFPTSSPDARSH